MALAYKEYYLSQSLFTQVGKMTDYEIRQMMKKYPQARQTDQGIPVFGMIEALNIEGREYRETYGLNSNATPEDNKLEADLKYENILAKKILNQAKLSLLIPKEEASSRVKKVLRRAIGLVKQAIKLSAPKLINLKDQRDIEQILTNAWNEAVKELEAGE
jgi:hypothetical protein